MEGIYAHADLLKVYKAILDATQQIATYLRYHSGKYCVHERWSFLAAELAVGKDKVSHTWHDELSPTGSLLMSSYKEARKQPNTYLL